MEIKNLLGEVIFDGADLYDADLRGVNLLGANLRGANLRGADLHGADLYGADLHGADLYGADLHDASGNMREIKSLQVEVWQVAYTADRLQIGCQNHAIRTWWDFSDNEIANMSGAALAWWCKWKPILQQIIKASPALPTKENDA